MKGLYRAFIDSSFIDWKQLAREKGALNKREKECSQTESFFAHGRVVLGQMTQLPHATNARLCFLALTTKLNASNIKYNDSVYHF